MKQVKKVLLTDLRSRFICRGNFTQGLIFLDQRFKSLSFLLEEIKQSVMVIIIEEATVITNLAATEEKRNESGSEVPVLKKKKRKFIPLLQMCGNQKCELIQEGT